MGRDDRYRKRPSPGKDGVREDFEAVPPQQTSAAPAPTAQVLPIAARPPKGGHTKFSTRHGFDPNVIPDAITEEAPTHLRELFVEDILGSLTYIDDDRRYPNDNDRPIGEKYLIKRFCRRTRTRTPHDYQDSFRCSTILADLVKECPWYHFYDFIELVADELKALHVGVAEDFCNEVNSLFADEHVAWRFNDDGILVRKLPPELAAAVKAASGELAGEFGPARIHFDKARGFLTARSYDPPNAIKEIVTALESVAVTIYGGSTLGVAMKVLQKRRALPKPLVESIEKIWGYANAEAGVRHGSAVAATVALAEADLVFGFGLAFMRYLIATREPGTPEG